MKKLLLIVIVFLMTSFSIRFNDNKNYLDIKNVFIKKEFKDDLVIYLDDNIDSKYEPIYYLQKDLKWKNIEYGGYKFGKTGCAPTSMAMAFSGILNKNILPTDVAHYLYNHTDEYNKTNSGSSGQAIVLASNYYNIKYRPLINKKDLENALRLGNIVFSAMGKGRFGTDKYNHAILVYGYDNGKTYALDPLKHISSGWVSINRLIKEQSKDPDDSSSGSNFYSLEEY